VKQPEEWTRSRDTRFYVRVFLSLALATTAEILTVLVVPFYWLRAVLLMSLALTQALLLAMNIMHLRWDKLLFSAVFFTGFATAILLVLALLALT
jgi:heme/copper-type cytochrome/quinol oxidase subunit 4